MSFEFERDLPSQGDFSRKSGDQLFSTSFWLGIIEIHSECIFQLSFVVSAMWIPGIFLGLVVVVVIAVVAMNQMLRSGDTGMTLSLFHELHRLEKPPNFILHVAELWGRTEVPNNQT